jgi:hypothetical protein
MSSLSRPHARSISMLHLLRCNCGFHKGHHQEPTVLYCQMMGARGQQESRQRNSQSVIWKIPGDSKQSVSALHVTEETPFCLTVPKLSRHAVSEFLSCSPDRFLVSWPGWFTFPCLHISTHITPAQGPSALPPSLDHHSWFWTGWSGMETCTCVRLYIFIILFTKRWRFPWVLNKVGHVLCRQPHNS